MKKLLLALALLLTSSAITQAEETMDYHVTFLSSKGECNEEAFGSQDLADAHLLDHIRGAMSFGHKAFALVKHNDGVQFVIVEDNCTEWLTPAEFFRRVNVRDYLGTPDLSHLQLANNS